MILIVDDKAENIFSLRRTLELNGFQVDSADSGEEALKKILNNSYSLIILDVQMPGMDGFEVAEMLSGYRKAKDIPIIFLSAVNTDKKFITKGYTSGGIDYITKPVDADIFMLKVKTLHKLYEQNRELNRVRLYLLEEIETRKRTENELKKVMEEQQLVLESMPQIAFTTKNTGEIEFVNEHWFVYSDNEKTFPFFHPDDKEVAAAMGDALKEGKAFASEVRIKSKVSGNYRYHLLKLIPVKQGSLILKWVGTFTDIHEQKMANEVLEVKVHERTEELVAKNRELEARNLELQQFASVASHDLKEPLRKIQIFSSIVQEQLQNGDTAVGTNIGRIVEAASRMNNLINDLLDYSRLSVNSFFVRTDLKQLVGEVLGDLEMSIRDKNAQVHLGDMPEIEVIPGQIRQVFQNLISNSLKFCKDDTAPVITIKSKMVRMGDRDFCQITVQDNGIGFDELYLEKIFALFHRLNPREKYDGTGIGLAIVKKIVEKHHGTITAHSSIGEGAVFVINLPTQQPRVQQLSDVTTHA